MFIFGLHGQSFQNIETALESRLQSVAACVNMPQVIKHSAENKIRIVYIARRAHLCMKDHAIFLCACSVLIRLPLHIALV